MPRLDPNSPDLEYDQIMVYLSLGSRTPQNEKEKRLLAQINEIKEKGHILSIPSI